MKPIIYQPRPYVTAMRWDGTEDDYRAAVEAFGPGLQWLRSTSQLMLGVAMIGADVVNPGQWIVQDSDGDLHKIESDLFRVIFEPSAPDPSEG